jgi:predicted secreted Zn-dependent protease
MMWQFIKEVRSNAVETDPDARNTLVEAARGTTYTVYVNGQKAFDFQHDTYTQGGMYN